MERLDEHIRKLAKMLEAKEGLPWFPGDSEISHNDQIVLHLIDFFAESEQIVFSGSRF